MLEKLATPEAEARAILLDPTSTASGIDAAIRKLLDAVSSFEPESIWLDLAARGIDPPLENRAKLLAAVTMETMPIFWWDGMAFEKTAIAFSSIIPQPDILQEASPAQIAWAVCEGRSLRLRLNLDVPEFEHEPAAYGAVVLNRGGFVVAPEELSFCQSRLDDLTRGNKDLKERVRKEWTQLGETTLTTHPFLETDVGVQLARLASVKLYVDMMTHRAAEEILKVNQPSM